MSKTGIAICSFLVCRLGLVIDINILTILGRGIVQLLSYEMCSYGCFIAIHLKFLNLDDGIGRCIMSCYVMLLFIWSSDLLLIRRCNGFIFYDRSMSF